MPAIDFEKAFIWIIKAEGGYSQDVRDPGGETKYGISKRAYPNIDITNLTTEQAKQIYYQDYWLKCKCEQMPGAIAICVFDYAVNAGVSKSIKTLQKVLKADVDGIIGNKTLCSIASSPTHILITSFMTERILMYAALSNFAIYGRGWTKRCFELLEYIYA